MLRFDLEQIMNYETVNGLVNISVPLENLVEKKYLSGVPWNEMAASEQKRRLKQNNWFFHLEEICISIGGSCI